MKISYLFKRKKVLAIISLVTIALMMVFTTDDDNFITAMRRMKTEKSLIIEKHQNLIAERYDFIKVSPETKILDKSMHTANKY